MTRKSILTLLLALSASVSLMAQGGTFESQIAAPRDSGAIRLFDEEIIDTVIVRKKFNLNNYSTIGIEGGAVLNNMMFNPPRSTKFTTSVPAVAIMFTHYQKMFGYMPYFGYQIGLAHSYQGFKFKKDTYIDGQSSARWKFAEIPFMAMMHFDTENLKMMANLGIFGGYRYDIHREGPYLDPAIVDEFRDFDYRLDYGFTGGVGAALVFEPFEFHIQARVRYGLGSLYRPNYLSEYYYRFAYPFDVVITAGVHIQLGRRTGKTHKDIRQAAYDAVYNANIPSDDNTSSKSR